MVSAIRCESKFAICNYSPFECVPARCIQVSDWSAVLATAHPTTSRSLSTFSQSGQIRHQSQVILFSQRQQRRHWKLRLETMPHRTHLYKHRPTGGWRQVQAGDRTPIYLHPWPAYQPLRVSSYPPADWLKSLPCWSCFFRQRSALLSCGHSMGHKPNSSQETVCTLSQSMRHASLRWCTHASLAD